LACSSVALASVIETGAARTTFVDSDNSLTGGSAVHNSDSDSGPTSGNWVSNLAVDSYGAGPGGFATSDHDTTIAPGAYSGTIYNYVGADPNGDIFNLPSSYASSSFTVDFTLTTAETFNINGWVNPYRDDSGVSGDVSITILNMGGGGSPTQVIASASDDAYLPFDVTNSLLPGDYRLEVSTVVSAQAVFIDYYITGGADANFNMTITPEPTSLALLALGGCVCLRRRR